MTEGGVPGSSQDGAGHVTVQVTRRLELSAPSTHLQEAGRGIWIKLCRKLRSEILWASGLTNTSMCQKRGAPQLRRDRSSWIWDLSRPPSMNLFTWLFLCTLYDKPVSLSKRSSWVLYVGLAKYWTWEQGPGNNQWVSRWSWTFDWHPKWQQSCGT